MKKVLVFSDALASGVLILASLVFSSDLCAYLGILVGGWKQTLEGIKDTLENRKLNVELLMSLSALGSILLGKPLEGAILMFIFSLAGSLETVTEARSRKSIESLMKSQPEWAHRIDGGQNVLEVLVKDLKVGDRVVVSKGETIPIDGIIESGETSVSEASITGESMPSQKYVGDFVYGGTLNLNSPITLTVSHESTDTMVQKIVKMVHDAEQHPSKVGRFIDRLEDRYAKAVLIGVVLMILVSMYVFKLPFETAFYRGMVLLVVASPCALIASVTPATLSAISNGASHGILVKGGIHFENLYDIKAVCFDKTGTLTTGTFELSHISDGIKESSEIMSAVLALETYSSHPLAQAITRGLKPYTLQESVHAPTDLKEIAGSGIEGSYQGKYYKIGRLDYVGSTDDVIRDAGEIDAKKGATVIYISVDECVVGFMSLQDTVRASSREFIRYLKAANITPIMMTGDHTFTANEVAQHVGIDTVYSECLPIDKARIVKEIEAEYGSVMMIGDGINDAPALASATLGVSVKSGTDIAMESSDIILMHDDLYLLEYAHKLSIKLRRIVIENIVFSLSVIGILVGMNILGHVQLSMGVVGHEGSTILVTLNSLRLLAPRINVKN